MCLHTWNQISNAQAIGALFQFIGPTVRRKYIHIYLCEWIYIRWDRIAVVLLMSTDARLARKTPPERCENLWISISMRNLEELCLNIIAIYTYIHKLSHGQKTED